MNHLVGSYWYHLMALLQGGKTPEVSQHVKNRPEVKTNRKSWGNSWCWKKREKKRESEYKMQ